MKPETRCVLVGNGPSVLRCNGAEIDAHDEVVRFNRFRIQGFEQHSGTRTTLWSTFGHGYLPGDERQRPGRIIFVYGESGNPAYPPDEIYRIPMSFYRHMKKRVHEHSARTGDALKNTGHTSGLVVAAWLLEVVGVHRLSLAGFDQLLEAEQPPTPLLQPQALREPPRTRWRSGGGDIRRVGKTRPNQISNQKEYEPRAELAPQ